MNGASPSGAGASIAAAAGTAASASAQVFAWGFLILKPEEFLKIVSKSDGKAVVILTKKRKGMVSKKDVYIYASKHGDFTILTKSERALSLPSNAEVIASEDVLLPPSVMMALDKL